jgi:hypothetical protein
MLSQSVAVIQWQGIYVDPTLRLPTCERDRIRGDEGNSEFGAALYVFLFQYSIVGPV